MRLILDTQILLAAVKGGLHARSPRIARLLARGDARPHVSVASLWEIAIKVRLGKLSAGMPLEHLPETLETFGMDILPITQDHALASVEPTPSTKDPFDRMLLAQCHVEGCLLVTVDRALRDHPLAARP